MTCPHCGESARFVSYRPKTFTSLVGDVHIERGYYHCAPCGQGCFPIDAALRLSADRMTPGVQEVVTLAGIQTSFTTAAERVLWKLSGIRRSESTIQRTAEAAGQRLGKILDAGTVLGKPGGWEWNKDLTGQTCGYVSVDATGILMQGPNGAKADGRMVTVGMVYNPQPAAVDDEAIAKPCEEVRYLAGLYTLDQLGGQLRRQAGQVGMETVDQWIALSDAGSGLEHFFDVQFPRAAKIVDFRHATEHLTPWVKLAGAADPGCESTEALVSAWCHRLKHEGGAKVLASLRERNREAMDAPMQAAYDDALTYFGNHWERMKYPEYLARGWQIGSGSVESACKNVVNQRLSMGGMRWGESGADAVAHLRALFRSEESQWEAFWCLPA